jgi:hypothetical protein
LIVVRSLSGFGYPEQAVNAAYLSEICSGKAARFYLQLRAGRLADRRIVRFRGERRPAAADRLAGNVCGRHVSDCRDRHHGHEASGVAAL